MCQTDFRKWKRFCLIGFLLLLLALSVSGCWGRRETEELAILGVLGLDMVSEDKVLVSLEIMNVRALAGTGQVAAPDKVVAWVMREEASTISNAVSNIQRRIPLRLFLGQIGTVVIGQEKAREGLAEIIDFLERSHGIRRTVFLTICDSAAGLLQRPVVENLPSSTMVGLSNFSDISGRTTAVVLSEFLYKLSEPGIEPIMMHTAGRDTEDVKVLREGEDAQPEKPSPARQQPLESEQNIPGELPDEAPFLDPLRESEMAEPMANSTIMLGLAAFRKDRLVGILDGNDARGYLWVVGRVQTGSVVEIDHPTHPGHVMGFEVIRAKSSITPEIRGETPRMKVEIRLDLVATDLRQDVGLEGEILAEIESEINRHVQRESIHTLNIVQKHFQSDIYGFGQAVYQRYPLTWNLLAEDWNEETFPNLEVEITVRSRVRGSGLIIRGHH